MNQGISHPNGLKNKSRNFGILLYLPLIIPVLMNNPGWYKRNTLAMGWRASILSLRGVQPRSNIIILQRIAFPGKPGSQWLYHPGVRFIAIANFFKRATDAEKNGMIAELGFLNPEW